MTYILSVFHLDSVYFVFWFHCSKLQAKMLVLKGALLVTSSLTFSTTSQYFISLKNKSVCPVFKKKKYDI